MFSSGRTISLNERDKRRISQEMVKNDEPSLRKLSSCLDIKVSHETVGKFLNTNGWKYVPAIKAPKLTEEHMSKRKSWAKSTSEIRPTENNLFIRKAFLIRQARLL